MKPPKLEKMVTPQGMRWYVDYAGMTREFKKDYDAMQFYYHVCECYVLSLRAKG